MLEIYSHPWDGSSGQVSALSQLFGVSFTPASATWLAGPGNFAAPNDYYTPMGQSAKLLWANVQKYGTDGAVAAYKQEIAQGGTYSPQVAVEAQRVATMQMNSNVQSTSGSQSPTSTVNQNMVGAGASANSTVNNQFIGKSVTDIFNGVNALSSIWFWGVLAIGVWAFLKKS